MGASKPLYEVELGMIGFKISRSSWGLKPCIVVADVLRNDFQMAREASRGRRRGVALE
ncbi:MAG: hypothetical protein QXT28_11325 [Thermofilaceae archaeon]